jgi:5-methylcytosine-specific restriction endonuclease McrA
MATPDFLDRQHTLDSYWRAIILFGRNVASYKFALAKSLVELSAHGQTAIRLEQLAVPFSKNITEHLQAAPKQATSRSSRFLEACKKAGRGEIGQQELIDQTVGLGFNNVIDAFHVVNNGEIPVRFFADERKSGGGVRLTDDLFRLREMLQFKNLPSEVEARWRLVETAWQLNLPRGLIIGLDDDGAILTAPRSGRRIAITRSRDALNGYQKGKCFYCFADISVEGDDDTLADVDHFFPRVLLQLGVALPVDGVWNLVLACRTCNRGGEGKSARLPTKRLLERLNTRNEFLITSHHPLKETLIVQTGGDSQSRADFLKSMYDAAWERLIHTWEPSDEREAAF